jgi:hypothetical protein
MATMTDALESELKANFATFLERLPNLLGTHRGKFALMRHREVVDFFDTARDAFLTGQRTYADGLFSVQEVTDAVADLGFYSHALPSG